MKFIVHFNINLLQYDQWQLNALLERVAVLNPFYRDYETSHKIPIYKENPLTSKRPAVCSLSKCCSVIFTSLVKRETGRLN